MNDSIATRPFGQTVTAKISGIECIPLNIPFKLPL